MNTAKIFTIFCALALVTACSGGIEKEAKYPTGADRSLSDDIYKKPDSILGPEGLNIFSNKKKSDEDVSGITVNSYLWRAALDTVSFLPLASADPFGGVILTDWFVADETPNERIKLNVFILSKTLRSDGVRVRVFKQEKRGSSWVDVDASPQTVRDLEDTILTRARQLRVAKLEE